MPTAPRAPAAQDRRGAGRIVGPCPGAEGHSLAAVIDDFEQPGRADAWFSYSDGTPGGVASRKVEPIEPGNRRALHVTAQGWQQGLRS